MYESQAVDYVITGVPVLLL